MQIQKANEREDQAEVAPERGLPGAPGLNSTRLLLSKIGRAETKEFPAEESLPAVKAAAAEEAAREAAPLGAYFGLVPIDDRVEPAQQRRVSPITLF